VEEFVEELSVVEETQETETELPVPEPVVEETQETELPVPEPVVEADEDEEVVPEPPAPVRPAPVRPADDNKSVVSTKSVKSKGEASMLDDAWDLLDNDSLLELIEVQPIGLIKDLLAECLEWRIQAEKRRNKTNENTARSKQKKKEKEERDGKSKKEVEQETFAHKVADAVVRKITKT
jgi:hypothetical protein